MQRKIKITPDYTKYAESSILFETGNTKVLCNVSIEQGVPAFLKDSGKGWITAEYSMLPRATLTRTRREVNSGKVSGRTAEIQRLIGRSLRAVIDLKLIEGYTIYIDCDVIQADGGTRTASVSGAALALYIALEKRVKKQLISKNPMKELIAGISVGINNNKIILDLDYKNDSEAQVDMNIIMTESGKFVEIQGTGEEACFTREDLNLMLKEAEIGIQNLITEQRRIIINYKYEA
ncbi:MAG: ribonuclease PH [Candidatus Cloacimonetes bacterium]|jgi:ribonuclease PH|nr:ribonuclease PH [Candidatus Cloacimonadota bacterium]MDD4155268.1 ribonuclease PH [Candidatus Cloacimonadota bacterium]